MRKNLTLYFVLLVAWVLVGACASSKRVTMGTADGGMSEADARRHDYYFLEATRQREAGNHADALALYEHCLSIHPQSAAVMYELAQYYAFLQQPERSRALLEK